MNDLGSRLEVIQSQTFCLRSKARIRCYMPLIGPTNFRYILASFGDIAGFVAYIGANFSITNSIPAKIWGVPFWSRSMIDVGSAERRRVRLISREIILQ